MIESDRSTVRLPGEQVSVESLVRGDFFIFPSYSDSKVYYEAVSDYSPQHGTVLAQKYHLEDGGQFGETVTIEGWGAEKPHWVGNPMAQAQLCRDVSF